MGEALTRLREVDLLPRDPGIGGDNTGGYTTTLTEPEQHTGDMMVCTLNVTGLTTVKIHHILHYIRRNAMEFMVLTDSQLTPQQGKWMV